MQNLRLIASVIFAQQSVANEWCSVNHDRVKNQNFDFYALQESPYEFVDTTFPKDKMIRWNEHPSRQENLSGIQHTWVDSIDVAYSEKNGHSLFGADGIQSTDLYQGSLGNCWFMHGASAVAS